MRTIIFFAFLAVSVFGQTALGGPSGRGGDPGHGGYNANSGYGTNNYNPGHNPNYNQGNYGSNSGYGQNSGGANSAYDSNGHNSVDYGHNSGYDHSQQPQHYDQQHHVPQQHGGGSAPPNGGPQPGYGPPNSGYSPIPHPPRECNQKEQEVCRRFRTPELCQANECCIFEWNDRRPTCTGWEDAQYNEQECSEFPREYCEKDPDCAWSKIDYECDTKYAVQQTLQSECKHHPEAEGCESFANFASSAAIALLCCCGFCGFVGGMKFMMGQNRNMGEKDDGLLSWDKASHAPQAQPTSSHPQSTSCHPGHYPPAPQYC